jgi:hypothetical protein
MAYLARGIAQPVELVKALNRLAPWPAEVVTWDYEIGEDWSGDPALFFLIVIRDEVATREMLPEVTRSITNFVVDRVDPRGQWDLIPYFRFISHSEYAQPENRATH